MKFLVFSIVLTLSVCLVNCWQIFPIENKPGIATSEVISPQYKSISTSASTKEVIDVTSEVPSAVPRTSAAAPKAYIKSAKSISPPSKDLLPPKEDGTGDYTTN